jgi:queuine tRNA-ribosyltransferase
LGKIKTPHGEAETPGFVAVGTHGNIKLLEPEDIPASGTKIVISNTYHLWRDLGDEGLSDFPGLAEYMNFGGVTMTDSGGFQVFSLGSLRDSGTRFKFTEAKEGEEKEETKSWVKVVESGVYFDDGLGEESYLNSELSVRIQEQIGADIIAAFDQPTGPAANRADTEEAMRRTHNWAARCIEARRRDDQMMYGVVQGGDFEDLRGESAKYINSLPFEGFAIGSTYGDGYGGSKEATARMLQWSLPNLTPNKPRHLFGVGRVEDIFYGVAAGIDTFDCVIPTREARHGRVWAKSGHYDLKKGIYEHDDAPLVEECGCPVCVGGQSRATVRALFKLGSPDGPRWLSVHNLWFFNNLMSEIRDSISNGRLQELRAEYLGKKKSAANDAEEK